MILCKYKDLFGKPNTGVHSIKIYNIAIIDFIITFLVSYFIYIFLNKKVNYWKLSISLLILGIFVHYLFCVTTPLNQFLGL